MADWSEFTREERDELSALESGRFEELPLNTQMAVSNLINTIASGGKLALGGSLDPEDEVVVNRSIDSFRHRVSEFLKNGEPTFFI